MLARRSPRPASRADPRKLKGLPPAFVATCQFDPLRDDGLANAEAMAGAGVPVEQLKARGRFQMSYAMMDVIVTGAPGRQQMARAPRRFAGLPAEIGDIRAARPIARAMA